MTVRIGDRCKTLTILRPGGFVIVADVRHPARSLSGFIEASTEVVVVGGDNLGLVVCDPTSASSSVPLPNHGELVFSSFGAKIATIGQAEERRRIAARQRAVHRSWICGGVCGFVCALGASYQLQSAWQTLSPDRPWLVPGMLIVLGSVWGLVVGRCQFAAFEQVETHPNLRLTCTATFLTLAGMMATLAYVIPQRGLWVGLATALCAAVVLGAAFPAMALVGEWLSGPDSNGAAEAGFSGESDADLT